VNVERGFNRLYVVVAVVWAAYCLVVYPIQQRDKALVQYSHDKQICYASQYALQDGMADCLDLAERSLKAETEPWSLGNFYRSAWWLLLLVVVVFPLVIYGCCRGAAAAGMWVWRGFFSGS
jgi:hypothetical protein